MDTFCQIFVFIDNHKKLEKDLIKSFNGVLVGNEILVQGCEIYIDENESFDPTEMKIFPDGFLNFPYFMELNFPYNIELKDCSEFVDSLLKWLWEKNIPAVASCDYENSLSFSGGYNSKSIPFPN